MLRCRLVEKLRLRSPRSTARNLPDAPSRSTKLSPERSGALAVAVVVVGMVAEASVVAVETAEEVGALVGSNVK